MNAEEARRFLTKPERLQERSRAMQDRLNEIRENVTGIKATQYEERTRVNGRHDAQETKIIDYMEETNKLKIAALDAFLEAERVSDSTLQTIEELMPDMSTHTYNFIIMRYFMHKSTRSINTTEKKALEDFARAYTKRKEGDIT